MRPLCLIVVLTFVTACGSSSTGDVLTRDHPRPSANLSAVMLKNWATLGQLTGEAPLIVVGRVVGIEQRVYGPLPFTLASVAVERTLKGQAPRALSVLQTGGSMPPPKGIDASKYIPEQLGFEGVRVAEFGERYLLFLRPYVGPVADSAFVVVGEFQGKLLIEGSGRFGFPGDSSLLGERRFATHEAAYGRTESDVLNEIVSYLR